MKKVSLPVLIISSAILAACNSGGGTPAPITSPPPPIYPNLNSDSVKPIIFKTLKLDNSALTSIDLSELGGHAKYKISITNPNTYSMNVLKLNFADNASKGNYYFSKNAESDNCFNQSWYKTSESGSILEMPANASCSLYTTSFWLSSSYGGGSDRINYTMTHDNDFGINIVGNKEVNGWCTKKCTPIGTNINPTTTVESNKVSYKTMSLKLTNNTVLNTLQVDGIALGGNYMFSSGIASPNKVEFTRYEVSYNETSKDLNIVGGGTDFGPTYSFNPAKTPDISGFSVNKEGEYISFNFKDFGTIFWVMGIGSYTSTGLSDVNTIALQGLDNNIWWNSEVGGKLYYQSFNNFKAIKPLNEISLNSNLPSTNSTILGVDQYSNFVIKTGGNVDCYRKLSNNPVTYSLAIRAMSFTALSDHLISVNNLYTNHAVLPNLYYSINGNEATLPFDIYYVVDAGLCQAMPTQNGQATPYIAVPKDNTLVITDEYSALKTESGYYFVSKGLTSAGNNSIGN
jgi:hypothetical protein